MTRTSLHKPQTIQTTPGRQDDRANVCGRWLEEVAEKAEIVLYITQRADTRNIAQQRGQAIDILEVLPAAVTVAIALVACLIPARLATNPRADRGQQTSRLVPFPLRFFVS